MMRSSALQDTLKADAKLDPTLQFPHPLSTDWQTPQAIFLTGATGFLGVYLLVELLQQTTAVIYCLVRANDKEAGASRLQQQLTDYQLWQQDFRQRIVPVVGDLSMPSFGLTDQAFEQLAATIDIIYHNGAQVNASYAYARLKASNVDGTITVLRLAGLTQTKPVHFISTLAVFFTDDNQHKVVTETDIPALDETLKGGYKQSKWVAETLLREAQQRGLPSSIYRPGRIWGDPKNVVMQRFSDLLYTLIQGGLELRAYPKVETYVNLAPVDYVSQAIVYISQRTQGINHAYHLNNPTSTHWNELWAVIEQFGYRLEKTNIDDWKKSIQQQLTHKSPQTEKTQKQLYLVLHHLLRAPIYLFSQKPEFDTTTTQQQLLSSGINCPVIDKALLNVYLQAFRSKGTIPYNGCVTLNSP